MGKESDAYQRGLDGDDGPRSWAGYAFSMDLSASEKEHDAYEQGKMDRARIEAEKESREDDD